jgi:ribosomal protein S12 methylthiotransferase accessory factor YcaO
MSDQQSSRPAVPNTTTTNTTNHDTGHTGTRELYEAGFSTTGAHPQAGIALARTLDEARQRLADMLVFCDPTAPATADVVAVHHGGTVERYDGTAGDIFTRVNAGAPGRTVIAHPLTTATTSAAVAVDGER